VAVADINKQEIVAKYQRAQADTGSPEASISMPELSIATCPRGSHSTRKIVAGSAAMVRWRGKW
jgi:hypothetical protein